MPNVHAVLSASAAERWMNCPGSVAATKDLPESTSVYAEEGTLAHSLCELKVRKLFGIPDPMPRSEYQKQLDAIKAHELYQKEMDGCSDTYLDTIQEIVMRYPTRPCVMVEQRVDFSEFVPDGFGTADCIILTPASLHIVDYKHGQGVPVSAVDNKQLKLYALGAFLKYKPFIIDLQDVFLHVVQPRLKNLSEWRSTIGDLLDWAEQEVRPAAKLALSNNAPFVPGEKQCRFCGIRATCYARAQQNLEIVNRPLYGKLPPTLTDAEVGEALTIGKDVADWLKKLESYATRTLESGGTIPGYKLVEGRSNRIWTDQNEAFKSMRENGVDEALLFERVPLTVSKLEKALDKKLFAKAAEPFITKAPGKPTMVPETDPRKPWSAAKSDFAEILKSKGD